MIKVWITFFDIPFEVETLQATCYVILGLPLIPGAGVGLLYVAAALLLALIFYIDPLDRQLWRLAKQVLDDRDIRKRDKNVVIGTLLNQQDVLVSYNFWKTRESCAQSLGITLQQVSNAIQTRQPVNNWYLVEPKSDTNRLFHAFDIIDGLDEQNKLPAESLTPENVERTCCRDISSSTSTPPSSPPSSPLFQF